MDFGDRTLFKGLSFHITEGDRIGLVGDNGVGKTTLMRLLQGEIEPTHGRIQWHTQQHLIGYLQQDTANSEGTQSGGEKMKEALQQLWSQHPSLLILDEPTNHLDDKGVSWLLKGLNAFKGTVIIISHDRYFLDKWARSIMELEDGIITTYAGNYTDYRDEKARRLQAQRNAYEVQQANKKDIESQIKTLKQWSDKAHRESTIKARSSGSKMGVKEFYRAKAKKKDAQIKSKLKRLEKIKVEGVSKPKEERKQQFTIQEGQLKGTRVMDIEGLTKTFGKKCLFEKANFYIKRGEKIGVWGDNGCGKSTLLKILQGQVEADEGDIFVSPSVHVGYYSQKLDGLDLNQKVLDFFDMTYKEEISRLRTLLDNMGVHPDVLSGTLETLSQGELTRIRIAALIFQACDVIILDEPYNHLDLHSRERLEEVLASYNGTLLIVSHDRYLMKRLCDKLLVFENNRLWRYENGLESYLNRDVKTNREDQKLVLEYRLANVIGELNRHPAESPKYQELDDLYQQLMRERRELN